MLKEIKRNSLLDVCFIFVVRRKQDVGEVVCLWFPPRTNNSYVVVQSKHTTDDEILASASMGGRFTVH